MRPRLTQAAVRLALAAGARPLGSIVLGCLMLWMLGGAFVQQAVSYAYGPTPLTAVAVNERAVRRNLVAVSANYSVSIRGTVLNGSEIHAGSPITLSFISRRHAAALRAEIGAAGVAYVNRAGGRAVLVRGFEPRTVAVVHAGMVLLAVGVLRLLSDLEFLRVDAHRWSRAAAVVLVGCVAACFANLIGWLAVDRVLPWLLNSLGITACAAAMGAAGLRLSRGLLTRRARPHAPWCCQACGYDLSGLPTSGERGTCPECGTEWLR